MIPDFESEVTSIRNQEEKEMKINYEFVDGNKVEIEVSEEWGKIIIELDRVDYNNYQKERKKHFSLQAIGEDVAIYDQEEPEVCVLHKGKYIEIPNESIMLQH